MKLDQLSEAQYRKYFESRLADNRMHRVSGYYMARCPFHQDKTASLSLNTERGVWKCHAGCGSGGLIDFEMKFSSCDRDTALQRIGEIIGLQQLQFGQKAEAIYSYTDVFGKELFQVVRYPGKRFTQRRPDEKGGWVYQTTGTKMVIYHLPEVITSKQVIVCEGEKDVDNLRAALGIGRAGQEAALESPEAPKVASYPHLSVTTSPRGAGKWLDEFSMYLIGKQVLIIPDNDESGRKHASAVASSCYRYAQGVKVLELPGLPAKGDVSDFLKDHTAADVVAAAKECSWVATARG